MSEPEYLGSIHFWIGCFCLVSGFVAFAARKGRRVHRMAGWVFALSMILLCLSGLWLSLAREILFTIFLSLIALHAVVTGGAAAQLASQAGRWITRSAPIASGALTVGAVLGGFQAAAAPGGALNGLAPNAFYVLAGVGALLCVFDARFVLTPSPPDSRRLTRHLGRMGFSFFLATGIFFFGNSHVLPEVLRAPAILATPVVVVVAWTLIYGVRTRLRAPKMASAA